MSILDTALCTDVTQKGAEMLIYGLLFGEQSKESSLFSVWRLE